MALRWCKELSGYKILLLKGKLLFAPGSMI